MKQIFSLLFILLFLICCEIRRDIIDEPLGSFRGTYYGNFRATYPGADDNPITVEDSIYVTFSDATFSYSWLSEVDAEVDGYGTYMIENNITFSNEITPTTYPYLTIDSTFDIRWVRPDSQPDTLVLSQGGTPEDPNGFFETTYLIKLVRMEEVDE